MWLSIHKTLALYLLESVITLFQFLSLFFALRHQEERRRKSVLDMENRILGKRSKIFKLLGFKWRHRVRNAD